MNMFTFGVMKMLITTVREIQSLREDVECTPVIKSIKDPTQGNLLRTWGQMLSENFGNVTWAGRPFETLKKE